MNNIKYSVIESRASLVLPFQITYGISAHDTSPKNTVIAYIGDITSDKKSLEHLVVLCNREKLSLIHLKDIVEDFICC